MHQATRTPRMHHITPHSMLGVNAGSFKTTLQKPKLKTPIKPNPQPSSLSCFERLPWPWPCCSRHAARVVHLSLPCGLPVGGVPRHGRDGANEQGGLRCAPKGGVALGCYWLRVQGFLLRALGKADDSCIRMNLKNSQASKNNALNPRPKAPVRMQLRGR